MLQWPCVDKANDQVMMLLQKKKNHSDLNIYLQQSLKLELILC